MEIGKAIRELRKRHVCITGIYCADCGKVLKRNKSTKWQDEHEFHELTRIKKEYELWDYLDYQRARLSC